jgi:hypothetical protein
MAWNNLTPAQQAAWKKKNFNSSIRVPQSAIDKLMAGGSKAANVKKYAGTNSKVMREAMNRFYGKGWDKGASGGGNKGGTKPYKPGPMVDRPNIKDVPKRTIRSIEGSKGYSAPKKGKSKTRAEMMKEMKLTGSSPTLWQGQAMEYAKKQGVKYKETPAEGRALVASLLIPGGVARVGGAAALKAVGGRLAGGTIAKVTGKTGAQQAARLNSRLNAIRMQQAQGQLAA